MQMPSRCTRAWLYLGSGLGMIALVIILLVCGWWFAAFMVGCIAPLITLAGVTRVNDLRRGR